MRARVAARRLLTAVLTLPAGALAAGEIPESSSPPRQPSVVATILAPARRGPMTRVHGTLRPFINATGAGAGAIADLTIERYFARPWKLGFELAPLALAFEPVGTGAIAHARVHGAYSGDLIELGLGIGGRLQHYGPSGGSFAPTLRLGSLDGLHLRLENTYVVVRNYYSDRITVVLSSVLGTLCVPVSRRVAVEVAGGLGWDFWAYTTAGIRHVLWGDGGPATTILGAGFGAGWVVDRFPCQYGDTRPCAGAAWALGPTFSVSLDRRF